ncbi:hypothetical protein OSTOST_09851 [Ostertagia ostertagi]
MLIVCSIVQVVLGCAATSPGTTPTTISPIRTTITTTRAPTTTAIRTTTRTTTTTTAAIALACQSCTLSQISFDASNGDPGRIDADFAKVEPNDPQTDCLRLTAICAAQAGFASFMEFNINQGGPEENQKLRIQVLEVPLECVDGAWYYRTSTIQQVNSVQCTEFNAG